MNEVFRQHTLTNIKNIKKASENNKLVVFVGAGVSQNSGLPSWLDAVAAMADDLGIKKKEDGRYCFSNDDYLKIPQYYYIERGENDYCSKVIELFDKDWSPNSIHQLIFFLNPTHIITTNYDDLLEKALKQSKITRKYCKVSCDDDLAIAPNANYIIKMHGELKNSHNSFVLKESDYDSYSSNFTLIETFVKGLIATHTLLFIGFSASDSNVRRIFQWIHDIIGEKNRTAYLIDVNSDLSEGELVKYNYLKRQGIDKLYFKQLPQDKLTRYPTDDVNLPPAGINLYKFLKFIIDFSESLDFVGTIYLKLKQLEFFYVTPDLLNTVFDADLFNRLIFGRSLQFESPEHEKNLDLFRIKLFVFLLTEKKSVNFFLLNNNSQFKNHADLIINFCNRNDYKNLKYTNKSLSDASLVSDEYKEFFEFIKNNYKLSSHEKEKIAYIYEILENVECYSDRLNDEVLSYFYFDYSCFNSSLDDSSSNLVLLKKSFYYFLIADYSSSIDLLNCIDSSISSQSDPILFYLVRCGKKVCANFLNYNFRLSPDKKKVDNEAINDALVTNLDSLLNNQIPDSYKQIVSKFSITEISSFLYDLEKLLKQISDYKIIIENRGSGFNNYVDSSIKRIYELLNFEIINCAFNIAYSETKFLFYLFSKILFTGYTTPNKFVSSEVISFPVNKLYSFRALYLCMMIRFLSNKELCNLISEFGIEEITLLDESYNIKYGNDSREIPDKVFLIQSFTNFLNLAKKNRNIYVFDIILNYFSIFEYIKIFTENDLETIIREFIGFSESSFDLSFNIRGGYYNLYNSFGPVLFRILKKISDNFYSGKISIDLYIDILIFSTRESSVNYFLKIHSFSTLNLITECLKVYSSAKEMGNNAKNLKISHQITRLIEYFTTGKLSYYCDSFLINIYKLVADENKAVINRYFTEKYKEISPSNWFLYYRAVHSSIIEFSEENKNKLFLLLEGYSDNFLKASAFSKNILPSNFSDFYSLLCALTNLLSDGYISDKKYVKRFLKKISPFFEHNKFKEDQYRESLQVMRILRIMVDPGNVDFSKTTLDDYFYLSNQTLQNLRRNKNISTIRKIILNDLTNKPRFNNKERFNKICELLF